jgi:hypothetical protein
MRKAEVLRLAKEHPELLDRAVEMERNAAPNMSTVKGLGRRWSWERLAKADQSQLKLFKDDQAEICTACFG